MSWIKLFYLKKAFVTWSKTPAVDRVQPLYKLKGLLEDAQKISILVKEHGKTLSEAKGDLLKGIQMCEVACRIPSLNGSFLTI